MLIGHGERNQYLVVNDIDFVVAVDSPKMSETEIAVSTGTFSRLPKTIYRLSRVIVHCIPNEHSVRCQL